MMTTTPITPNPTRVPAARRGAFDPWLQWRPETPVEASILTVAELAECRCPDICDRDHVNE